MDSTDDSVLVESDDAVTTITLNDPDRRNPLSLETKEALLDLLRKISDSEARCVVFQGAGDAFCSGGDVEQMEEYAGERTGKNPIDRSHHLSNQIVERIVNLQIPVVMKIDGPAVGGGAGLAMAGDVKLASNRAKIGFTFRHVGLTIDDGTSYYLPRIVGLDVAKELVFSGRILEAEEAAELGLVRDVYPNEEFEDRCGEVIEELESGPTKALGEMKRLLNRSFEKSFEQSLEDEYVAQETLRASDDHREGIDAFLEGREPTFEGE